MSLNPYIEAIKDHSDLIFRTKDQEKSDLSASFADKKPLILDLGCGAGNFLRDLADRNPEYNYLGFELRFKRLYLCATKAKKREVESNVRFIQGHGEKLIQWFEDNSVYGVHVNFPDPWAKPKQRKHRMVSESFMKNLHRILQKDGYFSFKTDHKEYFQTARDMIKTLPEFEMIAYTENLHNSEYDEENVMTEFEQLFKGKGLPTYFLKVVPR